MAKIKEKQSFDIMSHDLVPLHEILNEKESKDILGKYSITPDQLPKILDDDPVVKQIGAKPGQILKITRKSYTAKEAVAYRLVIESGN